MWSNINDNFNGKIIKLETSCNSIMQMHAWVATPWIVTHHNSLVTTPFGVYSFGWKPVTSVDQMNPEINKPEDT